MKDQAPELLRGQIISILRSRIETNSPADDVAPHVTNAEQVADIILALTRSPSERPVAAFEVDRLNAVILAHIENENKLYGEIRSLRALKAERPKIKDREPRHITIKEPDIKKD